MCEFCGPDVAHVDVEKYGDDGFSTMKTNIAKMFGTSDDNGIRLLNRNVLQFDNSSGEYASGMIEIKFCPFCGEKL